MTSNAAKERGLEAALFAELNAIAETLVSSGVPDDYIETVRGRRVWRKHGLRNATELVTRVIRERDQAREELHQRFGDGR